MEIESEPARFHLYQAPENARKYRLMISDDTGIDEIRQLWEQIQEVERIWQDRDPLEKYFCMHSENGRWIDWGLYLWRMEMGQKQAAFEYKENDMNTMVELSAA